MIKSSKDRAPRVGDVVCLGDGYSPWMIREYNTPLSAGFMDLWAAGQYEIRKEGPLPNAAPDAPVACEKWCGKSFTDSDVPCGVIGEGPGHETEPPYTLENYCDDNRAFCTTACRDRAAKPASGEGRRLAKNWSRLDGGKRCDHCELTADPAFVLDADPTSICYDDICCEACAESAGVFADSKPVATPPAAKPQPAPPFKCVSAYCKTPDAPRATQSRMPIPPDWCVVCFDGLAAAYMNAKGLAPDSPQPKAPRIRDVYHTDNWRDPDYLPNRETP